MIKLCDFVEILLEEILFLFLMLFRATILMGHGYIKTRIQIKLRLLLRSLHFKSFHCLYSLSRIKLSVSRLKHKSNQFEID